MTIERRWSFDSGAMRRRREAAYRTALNWKFLAAYSTACLVALLGLSVARVDFMARWAPDENQALSDMWQVHAAFTSIGFAGLAIAFQVLADPPLTAGPARRAVVRHLRFRQLIVQGVAANGILAAAALWLRSDSTVVASSALVLAPSVILTAIAYMRLTDLYANPHTVERMTLDDLKARTKNALSGSRFAAEAAQFNAAIRSHDAWHRRPPGHLGERKSYVVLHEGETGIVSHVRAAALDQGLAALESAGLSVQTAPSAQQLQRAEAPALAIYAVPGDRVHHGSLLLEVFLPTSTVSDGKMAAARKSFSNAFVVSLVDDPLETLKDDLSDLQDGIIRALRDRQLARVKRGYQYYDEVIRDASGSEKQGWRWLDRQAWEIDDVAVESGGRTAMMATEAAARRFMESVDRHDHDSTAAALAAYTHIWERLLTAQAAGAKYAREHLLVSLQNETELFLPARSEGGAPNLEVATRCIWTFVELAKTAIDWSADWEANRVVGYLSGLFKYGRDDGYTAARKHVAAGLLTIAAWILYLRNERGETKGDMQTLESALKGMPIMDALALLEERAEFTGRWRLWETEDALPFETSILQMETYVFRAALFGILSSRRLRLTDDTMESIGQRLKSQLGGLRDTWPADVDRGDELAGVEAELERALGERKRAANAELAERELDPGKVRAFLDRFGEALSSPRRLTDTFVDTPAPANAHVTEPAILFLNLIVPKEFLASDPRVFADPESLATSMAAAMVRAENRSVLEHLQMAGASRKTSLASLEAEVARVAAEMSRPFVLLLDSGEVIDRLASNHEALSVRLGDTTVPAFALYGADSPEQVVIIDLDAAPHLDREAEAKDGLTDVAASDVAVGIFDVPWDPSDDEGPRVRIETGEKMRWHVPQTLAVQFLHVEDASW